MRRLCPCFGSKPDDEFVDKPATAKKPAAANSSNDSAAVQAKINEAAKPAAAAPSMDPSTAFWEKSDLEIVPDDFFSRASRASKVSLAENKLTELPSNLGSLSSALTTLDVSDNKLTLLPESVCQLLRLQHLYAYKNELASLPYDIGNLSELVEFNVFNNKITELPFSIINLTNLELLNVASNLLGKTGAPLPPLGGLTKLTRLALFWNKLTILPPLGDLESVTEIQLYRNTLTSLPDDLGQLTSLKNLAATDNRLKALPSSIGGCVSLEELSLGKNQLTELPLELAMCANLSKLVVSQNCLTAVPRELLLPTLEMLDLSDNQIEALPPGMGVLTNLTNLFLQGAGPSHHRRRGLAPVRHDTLGVQLPSRCYTRAGDGRDLLSAPHLTRCLDSSPPPSAGARAVRSEGTGVANGKEVGGVGVRDGSFPFAGGGPYAKGGLITGTRSDEAGGEGGRGEGGRGEEGRGEEGRGKGGDKTEEGVKTGTRRRNRETCVIDSGGSLV